MSSAQSGLIPKGETTEIVTPLAERQVQVHRDNAAPSFGKYYGRLSDGSEELIGGPGSGGTGIPFGNDTDVSGDVIQVTLPGFVSLADDYTFEVRNLTNNTGATQLQIGSSGLKDVVDTDGNALVADMLVDGSIYLFAYDLVNDRYQLLGLAKQPSTSFSFSLVATPVFNGTDDNTTARFSLVPSVGSTGDYTYAYTGVCPTVIRGTNILGPGVQVIPGETNGSAVSDQGNGIVYPGLDSLTITVFATNSVSIINNDADNNRLFIAQFRATHIATGVTADCVALVGLGLPPAP